MKIFDIVCESEKLQEASMVWARSGNKIVRKYRCSSGKRKGRVVSKPSQCNAPINLKKKMSLKRTKSRMGSKIARKARLTKRVNPVSKRVAKLNK